jgi:hypothetical protein
LRRTAPIVAFSCLVALSGCGGDDDQDLVVVFGDSLTTGAASYLRDMADDEDQPIDVNALPGLALCDVIGEVEATLRDDNVDAVLLAFAGNNVTECVRALSGDALADVYEADARRVVDLARQQDATVVFAGAPAMEAARFSEDAALINERFRAVADEHDSVEFVDTGESLSPDGFSITLPCLDGETFELGCVDGVIAVRNEDGVHFDDPGADGYSSGSFRFARALLDAAEDAT